MKNNISQWSLHLSVIFSMCLMCGHALVVTILRGDVPCLSSIVVSCHNRDIPLMFCASDEPITNETLVAITADSFYYCDYHEGPSGTGQRKYFGYNKTTIWVAQNCVANVRICTDPLTTHHLTTDTFSQGTIVTSDTVLSSKEPATPTKPTPISSEAPLSAAVSTQSINTGTLATVAKTSQQTTPLKLRSTYVHVSSTVTQTSEESIAVTDTSSISSISTTEDMVTTTTAFVVTSVITTVSITTVSITTVSMATSPVTTVSVTPACKADINNYENNTAVSGNAWVIGGVLITGFVSMAAVVGIPLFKMASRARRFSRVLASSN